MAANGFFTPGQAVLFREPWQGRVYRAFTATVVQDTPEMLALYAPVGTLIKHHVTPSGGRVKPRQKMNFDWILADFTADRLVSLRLSIPGAMYSVLLFRESGGALEKWYINLEDPLRRTPLGFEMNDLFLDVLVEPDLSSWAWKDEDEFQEAIALGIVSPQKAAALRAEGERVAGWIKSGTSPFNAWAGWQPGPGIKPAPLPEGWDRL